MTVAALFVRASSPYKLVPDVDCYDASRDARTYHGPWPVVAHPPCRAWGRLKAFAKPRPDEKALAFFALDSVRKWGGILEHPEGSSLWAEAGMLRPGYIDHFGGFTLVVDQVHFGHRARKRSWLYFCRCEPGAMPPDRTPCGTVENMGRAEREATPPQLALWLVQAASAARQNL